MAAKPASCVRDNAILALTIIAAVAAALSPSSGASVYSDLSSPLIAALFFLLGTTLRVDEMKGALLTWKVHASIQGFSLLATPLVFYLLVYKPGLARWLLASDALAAGTMATCCMPTTTNTGVMFTQQCEGSVSVAVVNAAVGNFLGAFVSPLLASAFIGGGVVSQNYSAVFLSIFLTIILPLVAGLATQAAVRRCAPGLLSPRVLATIRALSTLDLLAILYLIFCKAVLEQRGDSSALGWSGLLRAGAVVLALHLAILAASWYLARRLAAPSIDRQRCSVASVCLPSSSSSSSSSSVFTTPAPRHLDEGLLAAVLIMAPQKTEAMGIAILAAIFQSNDDDGGGNGDDDGGGDQIGAAALPIILYHTVQLLTGAAMVGALRERIRAAEARRRFDDDGTADEEGQEGNGDRGWVDGGADRCRHQNQIGINDNDDDDDEQAGMLDDESGKERRLREPLLAAVVSPDGLKGAAGEEPAPAPVVLR